MAKDGNDRKKKKAQQKKTTAAGAAPPKAPDTAEKELKLKTEEVSAGSDDVATEGPDSPDDEAESLGAAEPKDAEKDGDADVPAMPEAHIPPAPHPVGAPWAQPIFNFDKKWTLLEMRLITAVLLTELFALVMWVFLGGLAAPPDSGNAAGTVFRVVVGATAFGCAGWFGSAKMPESKRNVVAVVGILLGGALAPLWRDVGVSYFVNLRGWLQEGSMLTLMGGLRGVATRLTLWLALLGASLATGAGKHIHVDLLFRLLPIRLRIPAAMTSACAAALMCIAGAWGFFDHIAIESYGANADVSSGEKIALVGEGMEDHLGLAWHQAGLDLRSMPRVLVGIPYDGWMSAEAWNTWVDDAFGDDHPKDELQNLYAPASSGHHLPLVVSPKGESTRGILVHDLSLVFPFGLLVIGLRFLIRALLTLSGHISVDPDEAHREDLKRTEGDAAAEGGV